MARDRPAEDGFPASLQDEAVGGNRNTKSPSTQTTSSQTYECIGRHAHHMASQAPTSSALILYNDPSIRSSRNASGLPLKIHSGAPLESESTVADTGVVETQSQAIKFGPFKRLPPELRCMIWKFTLPQPATIGLSPCLQNAEDETAEAVVFCIDENLFRLAERRQSVRALMVCRESRGVYLQELPHQINVASLRLPKELPERRFETYRMLRRIKIIYGTLRFGSRDSFLFRTNLMALYPTPTEITNHNQQQSWQQSFWQLAEKQSWIRGIESLKFREWNFACRRGCTDWYTTFARFPNIREIRVARDWDLNNMSDFKQIQNQNRMTCWSQPMALLRSLESQGRKVPEVLLIADIFPHPIGDGYMAWRADVEEARRKWLSELGTE